MDGSSLGNPGPSGVGGVLRDENHNVLGIFSLNIGHGWAYQAEIKAILNALVFCHQYSFNNIIIESDSTTAVSWANAVGPRPWELANDLNQMDFLRGEVKCYEIRHIYREANSYADSLAKEGVNRVGPLWVCNEPSG